jgi:hypothetical protein
MRSTGDRTSCRPSELVRQLAATPSVLPLVTNSDLIVAMLQALGHPSDLHLRFGAYPLALEPPGKSLRTLLSICGGCIQWRAHAPAGVHLFRVQWRNPEKMGLP